MPTPASPSPRSAGVVFLGAWSVPAVVGLLAAAGLLPVAWAGPMGLGGLLTALCLAGARGA